MHPLRLTTFVCSLLTAACLTSCSNSPTAKSTKDLDASGAADAADVGDTRDATPSGDADTGSDADAFTLQLDAPPESPSTADLPAPRHWRIVRGIIHSHTPYSHDACDGQPKNDDGSLNEACLADYRRGVCQTHQDFVFNTDHEESAAFADFHDLLLLRGADEVVTEDGKEVANKMKCPDGFRPLIMPGGEFGVMPVGLTGHLDGTPQQRHDAYEEITPERVASLKALGAVVLQAHTEERDVDTLRSLGLDGFEIYNLHANLDPNIRADFLGLEPLSYFRDLNAFVRSDTMPPDLAFLAFWEPNKPGLAAFDTLLSEGQHLVGTAGTDSHQNVIKTKMNDGERADSFRRMMRWFSNDLLVDEVTPSAIKDALRAGRGYIAFEVLGTPVGFDFRAEAAGHVTEMGETVALEDAPTLVVEKPSIYGIDADIPVTIRLLRAEEGGAVEVASAHDTLRYTPTEPGAFRVEVDLRPTYLKGLLDDAQRELAERTFTWIYANPIYVE